MPSIYRQVIEYSIGIQKNQWWVHTTFQAERTIWRYMMKVLISCLILNFFLIPFSIAKKEIKNQKTAASEKTSEVTLPTVPNEITQCIDFSEAYLEDLNFMDPDIAPTENNLGLKTFDMEILPINTDYEKECYSSGCLQSNRNTQFAYNMEIAQYQFFDQLQLAINHDFVELIYSYTGLLVYTNLETNLVCAAMALHPETPLLQGYRDANDLHPHAFGFDLGGPDLELNNQLEAYCHNLIKDALKSMGEEAVVCVDIPVIDKIKWNPGLSSFDNP
jgi:hypothetical protein